MNGSRGRLTRAALGLIPDEPDQVSRLRAFRAAHPEVIIGAGGFGTWQAQIPAENGETVAVRYRLCELQGQARRTDWRSGGRLTEGRTGGPRG